MSKYVHEIMNPVAFCVAATDPADRVIDALGMLGIHGAPVVDKEGWPVGFFSRVDATEDGEVGDSMSAPARGISQASTIETAAAQMTEHGLHHLVVVDEDGRVSGVVSTLDILRAMLGEPKRHPEAFPRWDSEAGVRWSDPDDLETAAATAPDESGVLVISRELPGSMDVVVWAQATKGIRSTLTDLTSGGKALTQSGAARLRVRWAEVADDERLARALRVLDRRVIGERDPAPVP
jgi:hypothetical protein